MRTQGGNSRASGTASSRAPRSVSGHCPGNTSCTSGLSRMGTGRSYRPGPVTTTATIRRRGWARHRRLQPAEAGTPQLWHRPDPPRTTPSRPGPARSADRQSSRHAAPTQPRLSGLHIRPRTHTNRAPVLPEGRPLRTARQQRAQTRRGPRPHRVCTRRRPEPPAREPGPTPQSADRFLPGRTLKEVIAPCLRDGVECLLATGVETPRRSSHRPAVEIAYVHLRKSTCPFLGLTLRSGPVWSWVDRLRVHGGRGRPAGLATGIGGKCGAPRQGRRCRDAAERAGVGVVN